MLCTLVVAICVTAPLPMAPQDWSWPQFRGPHQDGVSRETEWSSEGKPESLWTAAIGLGYSGVTVAEGRLFTRGYDVEKKEDVTWCLDAATGKVVWQHRFPAAIWNEMHAGGTLTTPTIDGDTLYVLNREGNLFALASGTGEVKWHRQLHDGHELTTPKWGFAASPLVIDDELLVNVGRVLSIAKEDGATKWESKDYGHSYSTPLPRMHGKRPALVVINSLGVAVISRKAGEELFFHEWKTRFDINAASPVEVDKGFFISAGLGHGGALLAPKADSYEVVWENKSLATKMTEAVLLGDHLYGFDEAVLKCLSAADGEERWAVRGEGNGAVLGTPERLIFMNGKGELVVARANPEKFEELSRAKLFDGQSAGRGGEVYWTRPTLVNGLIYCHGNKGQLVCRDHRQSP
jgi:outer membrane protein assembly factor BamB